MERRCPLACCFPVFHGFSFPADELNFLFTSAMGHGCPCLMSYWLRYPSTRVHVHMYRYSSTALAIGFWFACMKSNVLRPTHKKDAPRDSLAKKIYQARKTEWPVALGSFLSAGGWMPTLTLTRVWSIRVIRTTRLSLLRVPVRQWTGGAIFGFTKWWFYSPNSWNCLA